MWVCREYGSVTGSRVSTVVALCSVAVAAGNI